jgi:hypothetical protein
MYKLFLKRSFGIIATAPRPPTGDWWRKRGAACLYQGICRILNRWIPILIYKSQSQSPSKTIPEKSISNFHFKIGSRFSYENQSAIFRSKSITDVIFSNANRFSDQNRYHDRNRKPFRKNQSAISGSKSDPVFRFEINPRLKTDFRNKNSDRTLKRIRISISRPAPCSGMPSLPGSQITAAPTPRKQNSAQRSRSPW